MKADDYWFSSIPPRGAILKVHASSPWHSFAFGGARA